MNSIKTEDHDQSQELGSGNLEQATSNTHREIVNHTDMSEAERGSDSVEHDLMVQVLDCAKKRQEIRDNIDQLPEKGQNLDADMEREDLEIDFMNVKEQMLLIFAQLTEILEADIAALQNARNVRKPRRVYSGNSANVCIGNN